ncbi:MAG: DUF4403 family protein [Bacteroidia bacterium]
MKFPLFLQVLLISLLLFVSCKTNQIVAPRPINNNFTEPPKPLTTVGLPISINLQDVGLAINKKFEKTLYNDPSFEDDGGDHIKIRIDKRSPIIVNGKDNAIQVLVPMHIEGIYQFKESLLGIDINKEQGFSFNVTALIQSVPNIDRDWNFSLKSKTQIRWEDLPVLEIAGFKLDFPNLFGRIIQSQSDKISSYIDKEIPKQVQLKKEVNKSWNEVINPFLIDEKLNSWLIIRPKEIFLTPITTSENTLDFNTGISSIVEMVSGYKPIADSSSKLPNLRLVSSLNDKVNLTLHTEVSIEQINLELKKQIGDQGKIIEGSDYKINVLEAKAFAYGSKLLIGVKLDGKVKKAGIGKNIKGIFYIEGIPQFNKEKKTLEIKEFDFNVQSKDLLVKTASWLLQSKSFKKSMESNLIFDLSEQLESSRKEANQALNKRYGDVIELQGNISSITPAEVYITPNSVKMNILAEGKIKVNMNKF